ncbi:MAG: hypothetical protein CM1200mP30_15700 [Pseudomonadota bacterium]|nr:MAG: hypothetical protein CM1200mP30_15700 [Pseudomonadota bacterium]
MAEQNFPDKSFIFLKTRQYFGMALANYALDSAKGRFYCTHDTRSCRHQILDGIGLNPRGEETQIYSLGKFDLSLIATAEITLEDCLLTGFGSRTFADYVCRFFPLLSTEAGAAGRESRDYSGSPIF